MCVFAIGRSPSTHLSWVAASWFVISEVIVCVESTEGGIADQDVKVYRYGQSAGLSAGAFKSKLVSCAEGSVGRQGWRVGRSRDG